MFSYSGQVKDIFMAKLDKNISNTINNIVANVTMNSNASDCWCKEFRNWISKLYFHCTFLNEEIITPDVGSRTGLANQPSFLDKNYVFVMLSIIHFVNNKLQLKIDLKKNIQSDINIKADKDINSNV